MALKYPPFAACLAMRQAAQHQPPLKVGSRGPAVALLQGALLDLKYKMPRSTRKGGVPDGIYGNETYKAVYKFQEDNKLPRKDGVAGKDTIAVVDALMVAAATPTPHNPPPVAPPPSTAEYRLGIGDPSITPDPGAGKWNSTPTQLAYVALKSSIVEILPIAAATIGDDAAVHMYWYMGTAAAT